MRYRPLEDYLADRNRVPHRREVYRWTHGAAAPMEEKQIARIAR